MKATAFVVVVVVMKKRSALIAQYYCEGRLLSRTSLESLRTKRGEMTSAFHAPLRNSLLAHCVYILQSYKTWTICNILSTIQRETGGWRGGVWLRDRSHPARRQSRTNPFLLSLWLYSAFQFSNFIIFGLGDTKREWIKVFQDKKKETERKHCGASCCRKGRRKKEAGSKW